ncbi:hypothetical protein P2318_23580 [Myxococcaceae bacterium GXIMD 01537]
MSNGDKVKQFLAAPPLADAPPEVLAKADAIVAELDKAAKTATGTLQQVLRVVANVVRDTKTGALTQALHTSMTEGLGRLMTEAKSDPGLVSKIPLVLGEAVEWLQGYLEARGVPEGGYGPQAAAPKAPAAAAPRAASKPGKAGDGFESGGARPMALPSDDGVTQPAAKPGQQLESFKAWMRNPSAGKLKG